MLIDGDLMIDGGETIGFTDGIWNEGCVVDASGHITFVTREQQHVVEVKVSCFEHTHHLNTLSRFSMERNGCLLNKLLYKSLQGNGIDTEHTTVYQTADTIQ